MRLTRKTKSSWGNDIYYTNGQISSGIVYIDDNKNFTNAAIDKLGQLEDIEEELGIDLLILFKALKNGIWYKANTYSDGKAIQELRFGFTKLCPQPLYGELFLERVDEECENLSSDLYGKTWALTKEELEDGH